MSSASIGSSQQSTSFSFSFFSSAGSSSSASGADAPIAVWHRAIAELRREVEKREAEAEVQAGTWRDDVRGSATAYLPTAAAHAAETASLLRRCVELNESLTSRLLSASSGSQRASDVAEVTRSLRWFHTDTVEALGRARRRHTQAVTRLARLEGGVDADEHGSATPVATAPDAVHGSPPSGGVAVPRPRRAGSTAAAHKNVEVRVDEDDHHDVTDTSALTLLATDDGRTAARWAEAVGSVLLERRRVDAASDDLDVRIAAATRADANGTGARNMLVATARASLKVLNRSRAGTLGSPPSSSSPLVLSTSPGRMIPQASVAIAARSRGNSRAAQGTRPLSSSFVEYGLSSQSEGGAASLDSHVAFTKGGQGDGGALVHTQSYSGKSTAKSKKKTKGRPGAGAGIGSDVAAGVGWSDSGADDESESEEMRALSRSTRLPGGEPSPRSASRSTTPAKSASSVLASFITSAASVAVSGLAGAVVPDRGGKLFEYFAVVGASPADAESLDRSAPSATPRAPSGRGRTTPTPNEAKRPADLPVGTSAEVPASVLFSWPPAATVDKPLRDFCFASGCQVHVVGPGDDRVASAMFGQLSDLEGLGPSFAFLMSGAETLRYGVCVRRPEIVEMPPSFVTDCAAARVVDPFAEPCCVSDRVYIIVSRFPFFDLFFSVLYALVARERLVLQSVSQGAVGAAGNGAEHHEYNPLLILQSMFTAPVPAPDRPFVLRSKGAGSLMLEAPPGEDHEQLARWALKQASSLLSVDNWLLIIAGLLLEARIVFLSHCPGKASACAFACLPLLRPWGFQGSFVPLLPRSLLEALAAPVPYVIGVAMPPVGTDTVHPDVAEHLDDSTFIVLVDQDKCRLPTGAPVTDGGVVHRLPREDALHPSVAAAFAALQAKKPGSGPLASRVRRATDEMALYHHWLFASAKLALRRVMLAGEDDDSDDAFRTRFKQALQDNALDTLAPQAAQLCRPAHRQFVHRLIMTQHFLDFVEAAVDQPKLRLVDSRLHELASLVNSRSDSLSHVHRSGSTSAVSRRPRRRHAATDSPALDVQSADEAGGSDSDSDHDTTAQCAPGSAARGGAAGRPSLRTKLARRRQTSPTPMDQPDMLL